MNGLKKNLILGLIIIVASISGYFLRQRESQSYVVETETIADDLFNTYPPNADDVEDAPMAEDGKININTASLEQLQLLDGIGPQKAERIILFRKEHGDFEVIEDIMKVDGIGRKTFNKFKDNITVK